MYLTEVNKKLKEYDPHLEARYGTVEITSQRTGISYQERTIVVLEKGRQSKQLWAIGSIEPEKQNDIHYIMTRVKEWDTWKGKGKTFEQVEKSNKKLEEDREKKQKAEMDAMNWDAAKYITKKPRSINLSVKKKK